MEQTSPEKPADARWARKRLSPDAYLEGILSGDRVVLGQAITLVESMRPEDRVLAESLLERCLPHSGRSIRVGITGSPGVGKSTFIESLGLHLVNNGHQLAVLAIDPSSQFSKGSILGDKTRMAQLSAHESAFIRPSPAGESLGGVARQTREAITLCEAAGYDVVFVETVGVGQSETAVRSMVDCFLLLLLPGAGDELQGIKRGIVEMADLLVVNKADGERLPLAKRAKAEYQNALHLFPVKGNGWIPKVLLSSALDHQGIPETWTAIENYCEFTQANGYWDTSRKDQARFWLYESIEQQLYDAFFHDPRVEAALPGIEKAVREGQMSAFQGARQLLGMCLKISDLKK